MTQAIFPTLEKNNFHLAFHDFSIVFNILG